MTKDADTLASAVAEAMFDNDRASKLLGMKQSKIDSIVLCSIVIKNAMMKLLKRVAVLKGLERNLYPWN